MTRKRELSCQPSYHFEAWFIIALKVFCGWNLGNWVNRNGMVGNWGWEIWNWEGGLAGREGMGLVLCISWALYED